MLKEKVKPWTDALRSGEYPQTVSTLKDETGYCCLGVKCAIEGFEFKLNDYGHYYLDEGDTSDHAQSVVLTSRVRDVNGMRTCSGQFSAYPEEIPPHLSWLITPDPHGRSLAQSSYNHDGKMVYGIELSALNDANVPFDQIADVIDHFWERL